MSVRGDVTFEAGGVKYTARCGMLAYEVIEGHYDTSFALALPRLFPDLTPEDQLDREKMMAKMVNVRFSDLGVFFEASLKQHHPGMTHAFVANMIDEIGLPEVSRVVAEAVRAAQDMYAEAGGGADTHPPKVRPKKKTS